MKDHVPWHLAVLSVDKPLDDPKTEIRVPCGDCMKVVERAMFLALDLNMERTPLSEFIRRNIYAPLLGETHDDFEPGRMPTKDSYQHLKHILERKKYLKAKRQEEACEQEDQVSEVRMR